MKCPYCGKEMELFTDVDGEFVERGYGDRGSTWDEYLCECPECGEEFRAFEDFKFVGQSAMRMDE